MLYRLVDGGRSVVVIEHDLDVIAEAGWVIDLGPEGGVGGGTVVAEAHPEKLVTMAQSHTGAALKPVLAREQVIAAAGGGIAALGRSPCGRVPGQSGVAPSRRTRMKTYDIEVQRLKSTKHDKGMIELGIDALVQPRPMRDEESATSCIRLPVEHARSLLILLRQQLAEVDKLQPRSRRSGRS